ncbi:MAG: NAD(P)H-dependent oxidoreductase [Thaumarchaeota archaeon]|nr:NAD(P)H-dependent oxidoreductase [Nitrososphaerota archaeon]
MSSQLFETKANQPVGGIHILGISGSARRGSFNTAILQAAKELVPPGVALEIFDVSGFPIYNQDLEAEMPAEVRLFKEKIKQSDAVLFSTPEFNYSISALLKNAIEWGNRPSDDNSWEGKPAAIISASDGPRGGARAQLHLRQIMVDLNMHPINSPQLYVARAQDKLDKDLKLIDEKTRETLRKLLEALVEWAGKV